MVYREYTGDDSECVEEGGLSIKGEARGSSCDSSYDVKCSRTKGYIQ